jgi:hypothetical protein
MKFLHFAPSPFRAFVLLKVNNKIKKFRLYGTAIVQGTDPISPQDARLVSVILTRRMGFIVVDQLNPDFIGHQFSND